MRFVSWLRTLVSPSARRPHRVRPTLETLEDRAVPSASQDILYVGDAADNSVKEFNASTGAYLGTLVAPGSGGLDGPRGLIFRNPGNLLVANQNVDQNFSGEIDDYNGQTGNPHSPVVAPADANASSSAPARRYGPARQRPVRGQPAGCQFTQRRGGRIRCQ